MKAILVSIGCFGVIAVGVLPSRAADMPLKAPQLNSTFAEYNWTGLYVGANVGGEWSTVNSDPFGFPPGFGLFPPAPNVGFGGSFGSAPVGGGQIGYDWQFNRLVLGLEADIQGASNSQTVSYLGGFQCGAIGCGFTQGFGTVRMDVEGSIRARVGVAIDRWLVYGTGGFATAGARVDANPGGPQGLNAPFSQLPANNTSNREVLDGWTVGAGVEYAITNTMTLGAQYRYTDFGQAEFPLPAGATRLGTNNFVNVGLKESQVTARLNIKLDGLPGFTGITPAQPNFMLTKAPAPVAYDWTGFYIGANIGGGWGSFNSDPFGFTVTPPILPPGLLFTGVPNVGFGGSASPDFIGGGQIGYNWQIGRFVVGWEGDVQGTSLQQSVTSQMFTACGLVACASALGTVSAREIVQGSLRARLGYSFDRWLVYATGGWATADVQINSAPTAGAPPLEFGGGVQTPTSSNNEILNGWTIGAGFTYALTEMINVGAEYRHTDFGHAQFPIFAGATTGGFIQFARPGGGIADASTGGNSINAGLTEDEITARLSVKLSGLFGPTAVSW
jgi:opacity protein-like surface antigen